MSAGTPHAPAHPPPDTPFGARMLGAALLRPQIYEEVEHDREANLQATAVVVLASVAAGVGTIENSGVSGIFVSTAVWVATWYVWAYVTYWIGTRLLPHADTVADHGELLRTIGFSSAPGVLRVFAFLPGIGGLVFFGCTVWMLISMVVAVRQALDYPGTWRAIAVCAIGFPVYAVSLVVALLLLGPWPV